MIPTVTAEQMEEVVRRHLPSARITVETVNPEHKSWRMSVITQRGGLGFFWGPLTGFGVSDDSVENDNPFAPFDFAFESLQAAETYLMEYLNHVA
jgi:hypothetical protein